MNLYWITVGCHLRTGIVIVAAEDEDAAVSVLMDDEFTNVTEGDYVCCGLFAWDSPVVLLTASGYETEITSGPLDLWLE